MDDLSDTFDYEALVAEIDLLKEQTTKIQKAARKVVAYKVLYSYGLVSCTNCYRAMKIKPEEYLQAHYCERCKNGQEERVS